MRFPGRGGTVKLNVSFSQWQEDLGHDRQDRVADPQLVHGGSSWRDISLRASSPALALGFQQIDLRSVGPRSHASSTPIKTDNTAATDAHRRFAAATWPKLAAQFDGKVLATVTDSTNGTGWSAIGTGWHAAEIDPCSSIQL